jgi:site-specific DNA-cytosine methylase
MHVGRIKDPGKLAPNVNVELTRPTGADLIDNGGDNHRVHSTRGVKQSPSGMSGLLCGPRRLSRALLLGRVRHVLDSRQPSDRRNALVSARVAESIGALNVPTHKHAYGASERPKPKSIDHDPLALSRSVEAWARFPKVESTPMLAMHAARMLRQLGGSDLSPVLGAYDNPLYASQLHVNNPNPSEANHHRDDGSGEDREDRRRGGINPNAIPKPSLTPKPARVVQSHDDPSGSRSRVSNEPCDVCHNGALKARERLEGCKCRPHARSEAPFLDKNRRRVGSDENVKLAPTPTHEVRHNVDRKRSHDGRTKVSDAPPSHPRVEAIEGKARVDLFTATPLLRQPRGGSSTCGGGTVRECMDSFMHDSHNSRVDSFTRGDCRHNAADSFARIAGGNANVRVTTHGCDSDDAKASVEFGSCGNQRSGGYTAIDTRLESKASLGAEPLPSKESMEHAPGNPRLQQYSERKRVRFALGDADKIDSESRAGSKVTSNASVNRLLSELSRVRDGDVAHTREVVQSILAAQRAENTTESVTAATANSLPAYTVFELATGGCLDSMAAILEGFHHVGGTEDVSRAMGRQKMKLFEDLARAPCLGDTRNWRDWIHRVTLEIDYLKSGQPCPDYCPLGSNLGCGGTQGGELFIEQLEPILALRPKVIRLEMVPSVRTVNDGKELSIVRDALSVQYHVHEKVVECWRYGDSSVRQRLFIVALRRDHFTETDWNWPEPVFTRKAYPIARDIAVADDEVPPTYWRDESDSIISYKNPKPIEPGRVQQIGFGGNPTKPNESGSSKNPNSILSWDGGLPTQLTTNGGSRRPTLEWEIGSPIGRTRLTTPAETLRAATLDESSYERLARRHFCRKTIGMSFDMWLRELVNNGVPLGTSRAIDLAVSEALRNANTKPIDRYATTVDSFALMAVGADENDVDDMLEYPCDIGSALVSKRVGEGSVSEGVQYGVGDSGASDHLHDSSYSHCLYDTEPSNVRYATAGDKHITGDVKGKMDVTVLNLDHQPECPPYVDHTINTTTVQGLGENLWSLEGEFRDHHYDIYLRHGYKSGEFTGMYRPPGVEGLPESFIPMVYDHEGMGGWRVPYLIRNPNTSDAEHAALLKAVLEQNDLDNSRGARIAARRNEYTLTQSSEIERQLHHHACVTQSITVRVPGERNIRPAFTYGGLRRFKRKNWHEFHTAMSHMGEPGEPCAICNMFKGAARALPRHTAGKPREFRPGHVWHMDMIVFRYRSEEGCKYLIILTDETTQFYSLIPLHWKSDATHEIERWLKAMRSHPAFVDVGYQMVA